MFWFHDFKRTSIYICLLSLFFLLLNFQMVTVVPIGANGIKAYHVFSLLFILPVLKSKQIVLPPSLVSVFFLLVSIVSVVSYILYSFNFLLINYLFSFFTFLIVLNFGYEISVQKMINALRIVSLCIIAVVTVKDIIYFEELVSFIINPHGHPMIYYLYGGGPNLEATWLVLAGSFFLGHRLFYPYIILSIVLATLYASRTATLLGLMLMLYPFIPTNKASWMRLAVILLGIILLIVGLLVIFPELYIFQRFMDIGNDPGSQGRLRMWQFLIDALWQNPLGYGAGNAMWAIEHLSQLKFEENNLHNYFAQLLMDFGPVTFFVYLMLTGALGLRELSNRFQSPLGAYLLLYSVASLVQFRGAEAITWFVAGLYYVEYLQQRSSQCS